MAGNPAVRSVVDVLSPLVDKFRLVVDELSHVSDKHENQVRLLASRFAECLVGSTSSAIPDRTAHGPVPNSRRLSASFVGKSWP